jgi:TatD DNase family protein
MFCDAHFHIVQYQEVAAKGALFSCPFGTYRACTCSHDPAEYAVQKRLISGTKPPVLFYNAFGIHPQNPVAEYIQFLETLLEQQELDAVGEVGFDLFTPEFKDTLDRQEYVWAVQLALASQYNRPLIVHCRKATERLFRDSRLLKKIPAVVFHSFPGSRIEAESLIRRGIHAFFSFGKPILSGNKRALDCVRNLAADRLLFETDAPFQTLKGERFTDCGDIQLIYKKAAAVRSDANVACKSVGELEEQIEKNFISAFGPFPAESALSVHRSV